MSEPTATPLPITAADAPAPVPSAKDVIQWTPAIIAATVGIFILSGLAEIGGGWLVWQKIREHKPWYYLIGGFVVLCCYGLVPTLQPQGATFSRVYAVYGGVFVIMSYAWGWVVDGNKPDLGDWLGAVLMLAGAFLAWFWPRSSSCNSGGC